MSGQLGLWRGAGQVLVNDERAAIIYRPAIFTDEEAAGFFDSLRREIPWSHDKVRMYDRVTEVPRLRAHFGDVAAAPPVLQSIRERVEATEGERFNSISLNLYRDEDDSVAWHSDHEEAMVERPTVVLVSLGASRPMDVRERENHRRRWRLLLEPGSLLTMKGDAQRYYEHAILKQKAESAPRISVALRQYAAAGSARRSCAQCAAARKARGA